MSETRAWPQVPDPGCSLHRRRLTEFMSAAGTRPVLIVAPSGYGKSVAAAHYARQQQTPVLWLCLDGRPSSAVQVLRLIASAGVCQCEGAKDPGVTLGDYLEAAVAQLGARGPSRFLLVLDDYCGADTCELSELLDILKRLRSVGVAAVMTMRSLPPGTVSVGDALLVDVADLRFSQDEAADLASLVTDSPVDHLEVHEMRDCCDGHAALLSLLLAGGSCGHTPESADAL